MLDRGTDLDADEDKRTKYQNNQYTRAPLIKWRHIPLWRVFDDLHDAIGLPHSYHDRVDWLHAGSAAQAMETLSIQESRCGADEPKQRRQCPTDAV